MRHLFSDWERIFRSLCKKPQRLILFDYDGTLAPLCDSPADARLPRMVRFGLHRLASQPGTYVGIVSGRQIDDVKRLVGIPDLIYVGNHGFEIEGTGWGFLYPVADDRLRAMQSSQAQLARLVKPFKGAWIENKKWTLTVHYRQVHGGALNRFNQMVKQKLIPLFRELKLTVTRGNKVIEIRPYPDWNKGSAVMWLRRMMPPGTSTLFFGDDWTDEHAFKALRGKGLTVRIGRNPESNAAYYLNDQSEVQEVLTRLLSLPSNGNLYAA